MRSTRHSMARHWDGCLIAGGCRPKIPLRRSESFPNVATAHIVAAEGGPRSRRRGGGGARAKGPGVRAAKSGSAPRSGTPTRLAEGARYNVSPRLPPRGSGSGFGSQFKILNPKRCKKPKMSKRRRTSSKKPFGFWSQDEPNGASTNPKMAKPRGTCSKKPFQFRCRRNRK